MDQDAVRVGFGLPFMGYWTPEVMVRLGNHRGHLYLVQTSAGAHEVLKVPVWFWFMVYKQAVLLCSCCMLAPPSVCLA